MTWVLHTCAGCGWRFYKIGHYVDVCSWCVRSGKVETKPADFKVTNFSDTIDNHSMEAYFLQTMRHKKSDTWWSAHHPELGMSPLSYLAWFDGADGVNAWWTRADKVAQLASAYPWHKPPKALAHVGAY